MWLETITVIIHFTSIYANFLQVIFLEIICNDRAVIEANIELKSTGSPDYADM